MVELHHCDLPCFADFQHLDGGGAGIGVGSASSPRRGILVGFLTVPRIELCSLYGKEAVKNTRPGPFLLNCLVL